MSGHASAATEDLAFQNCLDSDKKRIPSESEREPVTEIPSKSERETVPEIPSKSERDPVPKISSQSEREPVPEIPSTSEREPIAEIPSKSGKEPAPEIPSKAEIKPFPDIPSTSKQQPRLKGILTESERDSDAEIDDGQQRLHGKKPRRWISEEEWLKYMKEDSDVRVKLPYMSIFKIPKFLKDIKREAYVPQGVSLGPYHHGSAELTAMERSKGEALRNMMTRFNKVTQRHEDDATFANIARNAIRKKDDEIRRCYEENIDCDEDTLSMLLCLDGCFILEVLKTLVDREFETGNINALIFEENMAAASNTLKDILMLENQIPLIVLIELMELDNSVHILFNVMAKVTCGLFKISKELDKDGEGQLEWLESHVKAAPHFLGFLHNVIVYRRSDTNDPVHRICIDRCLGRCLQMLPSKDKGKDKAPNHDFVSIPPAVELKNAGIKFRPYNGGIECIHFDRDSSTIYLPLLSITYDTEVLFRNLIAFEMCRPSTLVCVSSYVKLMDDLIDSQKDVAFLRSVGILTNLLGSDQEVADLFNGLFKGVSVRIPNMFDELRRDVNANYKNRIRVQLAELWRDHFSSPWKIIALAVAFAILCLTLIQTIYTVKK